MADTEHMTPEFRRQLLALVAASKGRITLVSGYRSPEQQASLFNAAIQKYGSEAAARKMVAPPGHSNHNKGIAADLGGDLELAHQLAPQFGLYFPMPWEKWHIEPAGSRAASSSQAYTTPPPNTLTEPQHADDAGSLDVQVSNLLKALAVEEVPSGGQ